MGFVIDNKLAKLNNNFAKCNEKVKALITKWRSYNLSVNGRVTISKSILLPQYTYIGSVLDKVSENHYKGIQKTLDHFVLYNSYLEPNKKCKFPDTGKAHVRPQTPHTDVNRTHSRTYRFIYIDSHTDTVLLYTSCTDGLYFCVHYCTT